MENGKRPGSTVNRLAGELSPYLLQHARNPVAWWPWCDEALVEARASDRPILLSIGYSACHWCHVMERECFEDAAIAALMNDAFVCIKVDREERPDLDQIYQRVVQLLGRGGGWPLTVFLTPSGEPFFGGTYFPPAARYGMPGFPDVLHALATAYATRREEVVAQAEELTIALREAASDSLAADPAPLAPELLANAVETLLRMVDTVNGGFGSRPKFPNPLPLSLLVRRGTSVPAARDASRAALLAMRRGGVWDHIGMGFHRYSTDGAWRVPHFEKMLYDNALLLRVYVDAARADTDVHAAHASTARAIATYVAREMTDAGGGFFTSQDADTDGEEGRFFVWDPREIDEALAGDPVASRVAAAHFGVGEVGNFEDHGRPTGKSVLAAVAREDEVALCLGLEPAEVAAALERASRGMFAARELRMKPPTDDKILTSVSALMLGALAEAGAALGEPSYVAAAVRCLDFLALHLTESDPEGTVRALRLARAGEDGAWRVKGPGFLDDHAYLANAALDVYEVTGDPARVLLAEGLVRTMLVTFWEEARGFVFAPRGGEALVASADEHHDGAVPSGTSMACRALLRLGALVDPAHTARAATELGRLADAAARRPFAHAQAIAEMDRLVAGTTEVLLVGDRHDPRTQALATAVFEAFVPNRMVGWLDPTDPRSRAACRALAEGRMETSVPAAYVCRGRSCSLPISESEALRRELSSRGSSGSRPC